VLLTVDIEYPKEIHDLHNEYPLCPEKIIIKDSMLSPFIMDIKNKMELKEDTCPKLVPNLMNKTEYSVDYRYLQFCIRQGLVVTKIHKVMTYRQKPWMSSYINFNTSEVESKSGKDMFKLMNNSAYGKTMENIRNRIGFSLVNDVKKIVSKPEVKNFIRFNENLVGVELVKPHYIE
jgi:hypothetical protein